MEYVNPDAVEELEREIRLVNEELARREVAQEAGRNPDVAPPRLPEGVIPPRLRCMSREGLDNHLTRITRDLEAAESGWQVDDD